VGLPADLPPPHVPDEMVGTRALSGGTMTEGNASGKIGAEKNEE
jgi:hypothetical protein